MRALTVDVAILGSGFGGSLTALLLDRLGLSTALIDRVTHPRFAIGESSTPTAGLVLRDLAQRYALPRLEPLAKYGTWKAAYPRIVCGPKRGFSYFRHEPHEPFSPRNDHANELLVAASSDDLHADTHWLRSDVDAFLAAEVQQAGIPFFDDTEIAPTREQGGWSLTGARRGRAIDVRARFVIDASGPAAVVPRALGIPAETESITTHSRAIYAHFHGVRPWQELLESYNADFADHPFRCDRAALHHVLEEGWMWQLRFDNGVTSAGFVLDAREHPLDPNRPAQHEWDSLLARYPSLAAQFQCAEPAETGGTLQRTARLQRRARRFAGENWALLPNTAGFVDPLHSTGIAQTLCGIERLVAVLQDDWNSPDRLTAGLQRYEEAVFQELRLVDQLVNGCYRARRDFRLFAAFSMLYFAAATTWEHRRLNGESPLNDAFLCADDPQFRSIVSDLHKQLHALTVQGNVSPSQSAEFEAEVARRIAPFNVAGLCDPSARNMYRHTAVPREQ